MCPVPRPRHAAIFDCDKTLFRTSQFHRELALAAAALVPGIESGQFLAEIPSFDLHRQGYRLGSHLAKYDTSLAAIRRPLLQILDTKQLIYDDVFSPINALIGRNLDIWFITVGDRQTQQLKLDLIMLALSSRLKADVSGIHCKIIYGQTKSAWLAHQCSNGLAVMRHSYASLILVDDDPAQFEHLPDLPNLQTFQIRRPGSRYPRTEKPFIRIISDFGGVTRY